MTKNQIDYWGNQEKERSNRANEAETHRANVERETENHRSAVAKETEDLRHHQADEANNALAANARMVKSLADQNNYELKLKQWNEGGKDEVAARIDKALSEARKTRGSRDYMKGEYYDAMSYDERQIANTSYAAADQADAWADIIGSALGQ
nr:hypothetical protein [Picobirnavirus sp.]